MRVPRPPASDVMAPSLWLSREDVVEVQLKALQENNTPTIDAGIEVLYRFAGFDPWQRSTYFGVSLDLGQSARFVRCVGAASAQKHEAQRPSPPSLPPSPPPSPHRIFYTPPYITLLNHSHHEVLSTLEVAEDVWKARVFVRNDLRKGEENVYEFTLRQRLGGKYDGFWFTEELLCDGADKRDLYGVI